MVTETRTPIVLLGSLETTFSGRALIRAVESGFFPLPALNASEIISVGSNDQVLSEMQKHHGSFGIIATKTQAKGRVIETFDGLVDLGVKSYGTRPSIKILAGMQMRLSFFVMGKGDITENEAEGVVGHAQALGACKKNIAARMWKTEKCDSNGLAANLVASGDPKYARYVALGPIEAARKFNLNILSDEFEDAPARTTFLIFGPNDNRNLEVRQNVKNRAIVVFRTHDHPGALHDVLGLLKDQRINLKHLHSIDETDEVSDFVFEAHVSQDRLAGFAAATGGMNELNLVKSMTVFGPFPFHEMSEDEYSLSSLMSK